ncbi:hypothetical protein [Actinomadura luteofluorescens]
MPPKPRATGAAADTASVHSSYSAGTSIAALARQHRVAPSAPPSPTCCPTTSSKPVKGAPARADTELPVGLDMPGKVADLLRAADRRRRTGRARPRPG